MSSIYFVCLLWLTLSRPVWSQEDEVEFVTDTTTEVLLDLNPETKVDIEFLNLSLWQTINMLNEDREEEGCELDQLVDRILPEDYEVASDFNLTKARQVQDIGETIDIISRLAKVAQNYTTQWSPLLQRVTRQLSFLVYEVPLSPPCMASLLTIANAMQTRQLWAFKFIDASGGIPSGVLDGLLSSVGDYEQCLSIRSPKPNKPEQPVITGQYCLAQPIVPHPPRHSFDPKTAKTNSIGLPKAMMDEVIDFLNILNGSLVNIGLCIPSTCSAAEIEQSLNTILYPITQIPIQVGPQCSVKNETTTLDVYQKSALYIFATLTTVVILASIYEYFVLKSSKDEIEKLDRQLSIESNGNNVIESGKNKEVDQKHRVSIITRLIVCFSLVRNTREMFESKPNKFNSVDFLRLLMLLQIILMHQYYVALGWGAWPLSKRLFTGLFQQAGTEFKYAFLRNIHNTDFFFALSGLLISYSTLRQLERTKGRLNYLTFALNMYLRFYPAVIGTILMFYLLPLVGSGPFWHMLDRYYVESCRRDLIPNLLTYNFYVLDMETFVQHSMCNIASWWVNSCFHLVLLSPLLVVPLYHTPKAIWLVILSIVLGCASSVGHILLKGIPFMNQIARMNSILEEAFYSIFYTWPFHHHLAPFALGILVGYLIRRYPRLPLGGRIGHTLLTIVFVGLTAFAFYWTQDMLKGPAELSDLLKNSTSDWEIYLNITLGKLMFCVGFLWIFYLCCTNRSEFLDRLFTYRILQPLYSLSMGLYLTNFLPPLFTTFSTHELIEFSDFYIIKNLSFNFTLTVILAYVLHVLFEKPIMNVLKIAESG